VLGIEREIKFRLASWADGERRLLATGALLEVDRHFETNALFDFPGRRLGRHDEALRLRRSRGLAWLTFKGPAAKTGVVKERPELETAVGDPDAVEAILRRLGLEEQFRYEKYRARYRLGGCEASLDEVPIGCFLEIEGAPDVLPAAASALGFRLETGIPVSYPSLYQAHREATPDAPRDMVFGRPVEGESSPTL
jgi:adenylate cyclase class 2